MRTLVTGQLLAAVVSFMPLATAQVAPQPAMLATEQYLFVVRGDVLYQFDVHSLLLRNTFLFPAPGSAAAPASAPVASLPPASTAPVATAELVEPPPPPPPPPPAAELPAAAWGDAADRALHWLVTHQDKDGKWDCDGFMKHDRATSEACDGTGNAVHDVGVTALAVLAMLGDGSTLRSGPHKEALKKAVQWLREQQQENGLFGTNASHDFVYDHAIAAYAMSEAYGLSNATMLKPTAQKGIDYLESHRNPYAVWRYQPRDGDNDTSVTTWAAAAMASAKFFGLQVNTESLKLVTVWYDQVTTPEGRAGYTKAGERSSRKPGDHASRYPVENGETMTAAALYGRLMLGQQPKQKPVLKAGAELLLQRLPRWDAGHIDAVYWYFGTYAMWQIGGPQWQQWRDALQALLAHQRGEGNAAGSWDPVGVWDEDGGRVFVTALCALTLQAAARDSRLVR